VRCAKKTSRLRPFPRRGALALVCRRSFFDYVPELVAGVGDEQENASDDSCQDAAGDAVLLVPHEPDLVDALAAVAHGYRRVEDSDEVDDGEQAADDEQQADKDPRDIVRL